MIFKAAFKSQSFTADDKIATAVKLLKKSAFLYAEPLGETQQVRLTQ